MRNTFRIHFYINRAKEKNGLAPIMGRITINGTIASFSCRCSIEKQFWDINKNMATGKNQKVDEINSMLEIYRSKIVYTYQMMLLRDKSLTARMVKDEAFGGNDENTTLLQAVDKQIKLFKLRAGKERSITTLKKMIIVKKHLKNYLNRKCNLKDIVIQEVNEEFILNFSRYLESTLNLTQSTVWVYCTFFKKIITDAHSKGLMKENPFRNIKLKANTKERGFLTEEEMKKFLIFLPDSKTTQLVYDSFLFCCFTGLSFIDLKNLTTNNIIAIGKEKWIITRRQKNNMPCQIKLMKIPKQIIERYSNDDNPNIFNLPSYESTLKKLKKLGQLCGLEKPLTFHLARHTFATMALTNGMPIESISKVLGHSNISTTQIYAKIINRKLGNDMSQLEHKLNATFLC